MNVPSHIGIIVDGNGRWARKRGLPRTAGHRAGIDAVRKIVRACGELGVSHLTVLRNTLRAYFHNSKEIYPNENMMI